MRNWFRLEKSPICLGPGSKTAELMYNFVLGILDQRSINEHVDGKTTVMIPLNDRFWTQKKAIRKSSQGHPRKGIFQEGRD